MTKISKDDVKQLAAVSQIAMTDEEAEKYVPDMQSILQFASMLQELNTDDVEPTIHLFEQTNVLSSDEPEYSLTQEEALKNAPEAKNGFFKVPAILD